MAKSKAAAPPVVQKKKFEEVEMPEAATLGEYFNELCEDVASLATKRKKIDAQIEEKYGVMRAIMEEEKDDASWSVRGEGWTVSYVRPGPRSTLVKELLIQQGVTMKQIEKATKTTESKPYVTLRVKEEE